MIFLVMNVVIDESLDGCGYIGTVINGSMDRWMNVWMDK